MNPGDLNLGVLLALSFNMNPVLSHIQGALYALGHLHSPESYLMVQNAAP